MEFIRSHFFVKEVRPTDRGESLKNKIQSFGLTQRPKEAKFPGVLGTLYICLVPEWVEFEIRMDTQDSLVSEIRQIPQDFLLWTGRKMKSEVLGNIHSLLQFPHKRIGKRMWEDDPKSFSPVVFFHACISLYCIWGRDACFCPARKTRLGQGSKPTTSSILQSNELACIIFHVIRSCSIF